MFALLRCGQPGGETLPLPLYLGYRHRMKSPSVSSLLYVSTGLLQKEAEDRELEAIVACALSRNAALGVTGALVFTGKNFAQSLEGPQEALDQLMASIIKDQRHKDVQTIPVEQLAERRFEGWSLAYAGPSLFVATEVSRLLSQCEDVAHPSRLLRLMQGFAADDRLAG